MQINSIVLMPPSYDAYHSCCVTVATVLQPRPIRRQLCDTLICFIAKQRMEEQAQTTAYEDKKKKEPSLTLCIL